MITENYKLQFVTVTTDPNPWVPTRECYSSLTSSHGCLNPECHSPLCLIVLAAGLLVQVVVCAETPHQDLKHHAQSLLCAADLQKNNVGATKA